MTSANLITVLQDEFDQDALVCGKNECKKLELQNYGRSHFETPLAVVYPNSSEEIQRLVELAKGHGVKVVVRSSQGYVSLNGASLPSKGIDAIMINLSRMDKIVKIDHVNRMALIEPGVTYRQLNEEAAKYGLFVEHPFQVRDQKSVISSLLDREPTMIPKYQWDIPDPLCCVEFVMGNGKIFRTGSAAGPGTLEEMWEAGCGLNNPMGPVQLDYGRALTGSQGTMAIVTWATVKLQFLPKARQAMLIQDDDYEKISDFAYSGIRSRFGDEYIILNAKAYQTLTNIPAHKKWVALLSVSGLNYFPEKRLHGQIEDLNVIAKSYGLTTTQITDKKHEKILFNLFDKSSKYREKYGLENIDTIFFLSTLDKAASYVDIMAEQMNVNGYNQSDLLVYIQPTMMGRNCHIEFSIPSGNGVNGDVLYDKATTALMEKKAFFNRPYGEMTSKVFKVWNEHARQLVKMKQVFDPDGILNPGKLVF